MVRGNIRRILTTTMLVMFILSLPHAVHGVAAEDIQGDTLRIIQLASSNNLFMGVFNPSPSGMTDVYTVRVWYFLHDPAYVMGPDAQYHSYRCELVSVMYNVQVPDDAVVWNGTQKKWVAPFAGKKAKSAITWKCGLGQWNDGQPMTLADFMFDLAMNFEWAYQDGKGDKYYDQAWGNSLQGFLNRFWGIKVIKLTNDYVEYTIYQDYVVPYDRWGTAVGNMVEYPSVPWETYNVMSEAVANGVGGKSFSWSTQPQNGYKLDMVSPEQAPYFKQEAQSLLNTGTIPVWLSSLKPVLDKWGISMEQAGITEDMAKEGYNDVIKWVDNYKNILISDGPYYVASYDPKGLTVVLKLANNKRIGYATDKINGKPLPWDPYWKEIDVYGTANAQTALLAVAKGDYAFYWYAVPYSDLRGVVNEYSGSIELVKTITEWWSLDLNLVGDPQTGLVNTPDGIRFNPFALPGVRYAMNWLINRNYIQTNILQGSGAPMFGPEVSGQVDAASAINTVAQALGMTAQGDEQYALKMIDQAMNNAAKALAAKGHKLEKKDGKWYFDGEPIKITIVGRVDDQRIDEAKYLNQILKKAGFETWPNGWTRTQANDVVYGGDPTTLQWSIYTEGWLVSGIQSPSSIAWDYWTFDYYVDPNWGTAYHNPKTVADLVNTVANGDVNKFIQELGLKYYNTPDKLQPLMDWTGYDLAILLAYNNWTAHGTTVNIQSLDQFWDLYKLATGTHLLNSPRVYTAETWNFYLVNKNLVNVQMPDPIGGLGSFLAARSVEPVPQSGGGAATGSGTSSSETTSSTASTTTSTLTSSTTSITTTTTSSSESSSSSTQRPFSSSTASTYTTSTTTSSSPGYTSESPETSTPMEAVQQGNSIPVTYLALGGILLIGLVGIAAVKRRGSKMETAPEGSKMTPPGSATEGISPSTQSTPRYEALGTYLSKIKDDAVTLGFEDVEKILNAKLPESAKKYRAWWGNDRTHSHAVKGWLNTGWKVKSVDLNNQIVEFERVEKTEPVAEEKSGQVPQKPMEAEKHREVEKHAISAPVPGFPPALLSRYEPLEFLGEGGFAKVYKVKRKKDDKIVALKIPRIDEKTSKTFIREVSTWLHLGHPNIVKLHDVDILPVPYLEMEYVEGVKLNEKTIRDLDKYPKPVDEETALKLIKGIAEGLKHAHSKGIYHRDLKPLNVLLKSDLTPKITDWGLAKVGTMSSSRSVMGYTPLYAAPEHLMPGKYGHTDARTDIWQLGVTFYELLTGKLPFEGYTYEEVFGKIVDENYHFTPPSKLKPELAKYDGIFEKLLAKKKEDRYQSVDEFLKDLDKIEESEKRKAELERQVEELKKSLSESMSALKKSTSAEEIMRNRRLVVETLGSLALAYAELNRKAELLNTLNDLKFYTVQNLSDLSNAISTVEALIRENLPVGEDFIERLKVLVHKIKRENGA